MDNNNSFQSTATAVIMTIIIAILLVSLGLAIWWNLSKSPAPAPKKIELTQETSINSTTANSTPTQPTTITPSSCPEAGVCNDDAQTYCSSELSGTNIQASWKLDLVHCLYDQHKDEISPTCRESLECRQKLNEVLVSACEEDKRKFCTGVRPSPGSEPLVACLGEHFAELSTDCADAWTRHDAAKPR